MQNFLFDFDGTIADSGDAATLATQACFKDFDLEVPTAETVRYYMGVPIEIFIPELVEKQGKHYSAEQFEAMYDSFRRHYGEIEQETTTLFPQMKDTLTALKDAGKKLFIVSSKASTSLKRNLKTLGIADLFDDLIGSDQAEHYKPAPDGVLMVIEKYHLDKNESVMIGDAKYDLQMGKAAGVKTCGCLWDTFDAQLLKAENPDFLLEKPAELLNI
ncbi:HAD family hydrolase [Ligilactobacillus aviarius]|uniref:Phosphatase n=1 Tax=Ligilactobacillus aviarius TaxID=1606 RepID=A0A510WUS0_9LACO|nr:HAD-IA family hydrolase [Ligilactobacillus aviarius]KRM39537.1 inorganic diphosphatase [Ligilactobacillus aviarius subsp. aviarius DSM 20655]GEK42371.1 phosphatase [Ligilactobacillus aviarius]